ncbi:diaminopimelate epimerase [Legionella yabuuchiae]|uniref:diaminopimelate epimerase n=1 Tax=Legionella yabuuchiae TaxID=376727 RepID=UPI00105457E2|nr:diaminopimelate epimerase [Legionella yabuuchiae]
MNLQFTKMHGLGNDFIVIDGINQSVNLHHEQIRLLSRRDTGIGFDQCLIVEKSTNPEVDFFYRIYNADGQEVGQCGNGARCLARFIAHYDLSNQTRLNVETRTTRMILYLNPDKTVTVNMGQPKLHPEAIPLMVEKEQALYQLKLNASNQYDFHAINVGNPHAVILVDHVEKAPVKEAGSLLSQHPIFPEQANIGFMEIKNKHHIKLRVYERGCGETQACGSGAVAAAAVGRLFHGLGAQIQVDLPGGSLIICWESKEDDLFLTGPAVFVYEGRLMTNL